MAPLEAQKLVALLLASFPTQAQRMTAAEGEAMARMYSRGLADLNRELAMAAVERLVKTARFLPTIAEIRAAAIDVTHGQRRAGADAWGEVLRKVGSKGGNRTPGVDFEFDDPLVAHAVNALGWRQICDSENTIADRARFIELYNELAQGARVEAAASHGAMLPALPSHRSSALVDSRTGGDASVPVGSFLDNLLPRGKALPS